MHAIAIRAVIVIVGTIDVQSAVELDPSRIRSVTLGDYGIIPVSGTGQKDRTSEENERIEKPIL
jgi:hypothetical protein